MFFKLSVKKSIARMCRVQTVVTSGCHGMPLPFASDLAASKLCSDLDALRDMSVDDLAQLLYHNVTIDLLDRECPVVTVRRRVRPMTHAWFDAECRAARRRTRAAERRVRTFEGCMRRRRSGAEVGREVEAEGCCMNTRSTSIEKMTLPSARLRLWTLHDDLGETSGGETGDHTADESASFLTIRSHQ